MPTLLNTLQGHDLFFLEMVANSWGIDLSAPDAASARPIIIAAMTDQTMFLEIFEALPDPAKEALLAVYNNDGHMPWAKFSREYGEIRVMGASRRDRERPDLIPANPAEILWYRAIIGRSFLNLNNLPQEYVYMPEEILDFLQPYGLQKQTQEVRMASPGETAIVKLATDAILQDSCTLLAANRKGMNIKEDDKTYLVVNKDFLLDLLKSAAILFDNGQPNAEATRLFLESQKVKSLSTLFSSWLSSTQIKELQYLPNLQFEVKPDLNPVLSRKNINDKIFALTSDQWWNINSFVKSVFYSNADFLRPTGDYDSWYVFDQKTAESLRGFRCWDQIEGEYIRYLIRGPLHWLGLLDLASSSDIAETNAFRITANGSALISDQIPQNMPNNDEKARMDAYGNISVSAQVSLAIRYQLARFCDWQTKTDDIYSYRISSLSMENALNQGLKASQLILLLQKALSHPIPIQVKTSLENWEKNGKECELMEVVLLRVQKPEILTALQKSKHGRNIEEILSPTLAIIRKGSSENVIKSLYELGYLTGWNIS